VLKFWTESRKGTRGSCKLNTRGYEKLAFFDQYIALFPKQYKIWPWLQWKMNRKSYVMYQILSFLMTFNDP